MALLQTMAGRDGGEGRGEAIQTYETDARTIDNSRV